MSNAGIIQNKNAYREFTHQIYQEFEWKFMDFMKDNNLNPEIMLELLHKFIERRIIYEIKK